MITTPMAAPLYQAHRRVAELQEVETFPTRQNRCGQMSKKVRNTTVFRHQSVALSPEGVVFDVYTSVHVCEEEDGCEQSDLPLLWMCSGCASMPNSCMSPRKPSNTHI